MRIPRLRRASRRLRLRRVGFFAGVLLQPRIHAIGEIQPRMFAEEYDVTFRWYRHTYLLLFLVLEALGSYAVFSRWTPPETRNVIVGLWPLCGMFPVLVLGSHLFKDMKRTEAWYWMFAAAIALEVLALLLPAVNVN